MLHVVLTQEGESAHHGGMATLAGGIRASFVMDGRGAIDAHAQQKMIVREELRQPGREERAVGLDAVGDLRTGPGIAALQSQKRAVEVLPHQQGFAALKGKGMRRKGQGQKTANQTRKRGFVHAMHPRLRIKLGAAQVKTVGTPQIAIRAGRLDKQRKWTHGGCLGKGRK